MNGLPASSEALSSLKSGTGRFGAATCGAARSCSLFRGVQCSMSWWLMKFTTKDLYKGASTMVFDVFESRYEQASPIFLVLTWRLRLLRPGQKAWSVTPTWPSQITCAAGCWWVADYTILPGTIFKATSRHHGYLSLSRSWNLPSASSWRKSPEHSKTTLSVIIKYLPISSACKKMILPRRDLFLNLSRMIFSWFLAWRIQPGSPRAEPSWTREVLVPELLLSLRCWRIKGAFQGSKPNQRLHLHHCFGRSLPTSQNEAKSSLRCSVMRFREPLALQPIPIAWHP